MYAKGEKTDQVLLKSFSTQAIPMERYNFVTAAAIKFGAFSFPPLKEHRGDEHNCDGRNGRLDEIAILTENQISPTGFPWSPGPWIVPGAPISYFRSFRKS